MPECPKSAKELVDFRFAVTRKLSEQTGDPPSLLRKLDADCSRNQVFSSGGFLLATVGVRKKSKVFFPDALDELKPKVSKDAVDFAATNRVVRKSIFLVNELPCFAVKNFTPVQVK